MYTRLSHFSTDCGFSDAAPRKTGEVLLHAQTVAVAQCLARLLGLCDERTVTCCWWTTLLRGVPTDSTIRTSGLRANSPVFVFMMDRACSLRLSV